MPVTPTPLYGASRKRAGWSARTHAVRADAAGLPPVASYPDQRRHIGACNVRLKRQLLRCILRPPDAGPVRHRRYIAW